MAIGHENLHNTLPPSLVQPITRQLLLMKLPCDLLALAAWI